MNLDKYRGCKRFVSKYDEMLKSDKQYKDLIEKQDFLLINHITRISLEMSCYASNGMLLITHPERIPDVIDDDIMEMIYDRSKEYVRKYELENGIDIP